MARHLITFYFQQLQDLLGHSNKFLPQIPNRFRQPQRQQRHRTEFQRQHQVSYAQTSLDKCSIEKSNTLAQLIGWFQGRQDRRPIRPWNLAVDRDEPRWSTRLPERRTAPKWKPRSAFKTARSRHWSLHSQQDVRRRRRDWLRVLATVVSTKLRRPESLQRLNAARGEQEASIVESRADRVAGQNDLRERSHQFRKPNVAAREKTATDGQVGLLRVPTLLQSISWLRPTRPLSRPGRSRKQQAAIYVPDRNLSVDLHRGESDERGADAVCAGQDVRDKSAGEAGGSERSA